MKGVASFAPWRDKQKRLAFGRQLAEIYIRIRDIVSDGEIIVAALEFYIQRFKNQGPASEGTWLSREPGYRKLVQAQSVNLKRLSASINAVATTIDILSSEIREELTRFIDFKFDALHVLSAALEEGHLPVDVDIQRRPDKPFAHVESINMLTLEWEQAAFELALRYIQEEKPQQTLESLREQGEAIRAVLVEHFTLDEILDISPEGLHRVSYNFRDKFL